MKKLSALLLVLMAVVLIAASCKPKQVAAVPPDPTPTPTPTVSVPEKLIAQYKQGEVEQCLYRASTVYKCSRNAPDAGSEFYSADGTKLGGCYYFSGSVDMICKESSECKTIYRVAKNIWGKPEVVWTDGQ
jgi:hypothetical protein